MKNLLVLLLLACSITEGACSSFPALTEQDRRSIASANLTEAQKLLTAHFINYIRKEGQRLGISPALAFGQSPTGINDREYRLDRLEELREKREAQRFQIERMQSRNVRKEPLPRDEAVLLIARQLGVSPDRTKELLAKYEPQPSGIVTISETEDDSQYVSAKDLFKDPTKLVRKKSSKKTKAPKAVKVPDPQKEEQRIQKEKRREETKQQREKHLNDSRLAREKRKQQREEEKQAKKNPPADNSEQKTIELHSPDEPGWDADEPKKEIQ